MAGQNLVAFFPALAKAKDGYVTTTGAFPNASTKNGPDEDWIAGVAGEARRRVDRRGARHGLDVPLLRAAPAGVAEGPLLDEAKAGRTGGQDAGLLRRRLRQDGRLRGAAHARRSTRRRSRDQDLVGKTASGPAQGTLDDRPTARSAAPRSAPRSSLRTRASSCSAATTTEEPLGHPSRCSRRRSSLSGDAASRSVRLAPGSPGSPRTAEAVDAHGRGGPSRRERRRRPRLCCVWIALGAVGARRWAPSPATARPSAVTTAPARSRRRARPPRGSRPVLVLGAAQDVARRELQLLLGRDAVEVCCLAGRGRPACSRPRRGAPRGRRRRRRRRARR